VRSALAHFHRAYGAGPRHLLGMLICFAVVGYVVHLLRDVATAPRMAIWFLGALLAHDLVLLPAYTVLNAALSRILRTRREGRQTTLVLNCIRVPALASGLLLLIFLPSISKQRPGIVMSATGLNQDPYLGRWLLLSAAFFVTSGVVYALRRRQLVRSADSRQPGGPIQPTG